MEDMENGGTPEEQQPMGMPGDAPAAGGDDAMSGAPEPAAPVGGDTSMDDHPDHDSMTDDELQKHMDEEHGGEEGSDSGMEEGGNPNMPA